MGSCWRGNKCWYPRTSDILKQLHQDNQGIETTIMLACKSVYWPKINDDIVKLAKSCVLCQDMNNKEPLIPSETPSEGWTNLWNQRKEPYHMVWLLLKVPNNERVAEHGYTSRSNRGDRRCVFPVWSAWSDQTGQRSIICEWACPESYVCCGESNVWHNLPTMRNQMVSQKGMSDGSNQ